MDGPWIQAFSLDSWINNMPSWTYNKLRSNGRVDEMKMYDVTGAIFEGMDVYKDKPEKQPKMNPKTSGEVTETQL